MSEIISRLNKMIDDYPYVEDQPFSVYSDAKSEIERLESLVAVVPKGWKLVPVEPTSEMLDEIELVDRYSDCALTVRYRAMLDAAPEAPGQEKGQ